MSRLHDTAYAGGFLRYDEETDLPKIPEDYRFRVVYFGSHGYAFNVKLQQRWFGPFWFTQGNSLAGNSKGSIRTAAVNALKKAIDSEVDESLLGNYPPKSAK